MNLNGAFGGVVMTNEGFSMGDGMDFSETSPTSSVQLRKAREREKMSNAGLPDPDSWFHGNISRAEAEEKLGENGEEGSFLVRQTASGDFALSVIKDGEFHHIQIYRHDHDAFFSIEDGLVIHGLDELIRYYQMCPADPEEQDKILLKEAVNQSSPPPDCRRHGRTNLLHRATKEGNTEIVQTLVSCGHRSLEAKNEIGQTAVHLAAMNGFVDILDILIEGGANANARDTGACTPLYYTCMFNQPACAEILLKKGNANPTLRSNENGMVPLHEAASKGHNECIRVLLKYHAPLRPRTEDNKLPIQLAIENNLTETVEILRKFRHTDPPPNRDDWYHSCLDRQEALTLLQQCHTMNNNSDVQSSYFLLRRSANKRKVYVLTVLYQGNSFNFVIQREGKFYYIDDGPYLESLEQIVNHYSRWTDGLPAKLQISVRPTQSFLSPTTTPSDPLLIPPPLPKRTPRSSPNNFSMETTNNNKFPLYSKDDIPPEWIDIGEQIGSGEYGEVFEGKLKVPGGIEMIVAVKTLKEEMMEVSKHDFLREARVMMNLEHNNIVRLIGVSWNVRQIYMVQELLSLGSLQEYLVDHRDEISADPHIRLWAHQISKGLVYLTEKLIVHRDLAARNILLSSSAVAKIGDFGLSRALNLESNYYTASKGGKWPIKWYAPESCTHGTFSHASDVWSFGITLWEMYSYGEIPYGDLQGMEVIELVGNGYRLEKPEECPDAVFDVIQRCWSERAEDRPTFRFLEEFFAN